MVQVEQEIPQHIARQPKPMTPPLQARITPNFDSAFICSVFPLPRQTTLSRMIYVGKSEEYPDGYTRRYTYYLPAAKPGGYSVLEITPPGQLVRSSIVTEDTKANDYTIRPDTALNEAMSLVQDWSGNFAQAGGNRPGIDVIQGPEPTADELKELHRRQRDFCRFFVNEADNFWIQGHRDKIRMNGLHRMSAMYLGLENDPNHPWVTDLVNNYVSCVACGASIPEKVLVCRHCQRDLIEFCEARNLPERIIAEASPRLAKLVVALRAEAAKSSGKRSAKASAEDETE